MKSKRGRFAILIVLELILFSLFYLNLYLVNDAWPFYLYIGLFPIILFYLVYISDHARKMLKTVFLSKDLIIFLVVISVWFYIYALEKISLGYIFSTLYFPVLIEELNFRFVITEYLTEVTTFARAVVLQAILYTLLYSSYLVVLPGAYPGLYGPFFFIDMLSVGLIYGVVYYLRRNLYIDISFHLSLWLMAGIIPYLLIWIPYTFAPT